MPEIKTDCVYEYKYEPSALDGHIYDVFRIIDIKRDKKSRYIWLDIYSYVKGKQNPWQIDQKFFDKYCRIIKNEEELYALLL